MATSPSLCLALIITPSPSRGLEPMPEPRRPDSICINRTRQSLPRLVYFTCPLVLCILISAHSFTICTRAAVARVHVYRTTCVLRGPRGGARAPPRAPGVPVASSHTAREEAVVE